LKQKFAGTPLKRIALHFAGHRTTGDIVLTSSGLEGGPIYALSGPIRDALAAGPVTLCIDLRPDLDDAALSARLATPARGRSLGNFLRQELALPPVAIGLIQEARHGTRCVQPLASLIRALPVEVTGVSPIERAISSAGGVAFSEIDENFMLRSKPGVFLAGEMLDWEAPTGGYLLQACFSTGVAAARGVMKKEGLP
jgi:predicted flavoprotein YhiN